nr:class I SAM-dependent methyltransferase [Deinococcus arboris]
MSETDALIQAKVFGGHVTPATQIAFRLLADALPEYAVLEAGGRGLDVGCGVAGALLNMALIFPKSHQVGLELLPSIADEARRRVRALGVETRVEIRCQDVQTLDEERAYDTAFWAQPFFPEAIRAGVLQVILRALRPGGTLLMQELFVPPMDGDMAAMRGFALSQLLFRHRGMVFAPTAEELVQEGLAAGFESVRVAQTPFGRLAILRRPELPEGRLKNTLSAE